MRPTKAQRQYRAAKAAGNLRRAQLSAEALQRQLSDTVPDLQLEFPFHATRRWRFDLASPSRMIAVEIEGGAFTGGRHTRGAGFVGDLEKYNEAVIDGWRLIRVTPDMIPGGYAATLVGRLLHADHR